MQTPNKLPTPSPQMHTQRLPIFPPSSHHHSQPQPQLSPVTPITPRSPLYSCLSESSTAPAVTAPLRLPVQSLTHIQIMRPTLQFAVIGLNLPKRENICS
ncbi:unnamed protein product [Cuscuta europaea]|uniref:Uncharacterized protein n=1 Tax=Cuscuta europaea TaxID=41803 RepID=A0A9P0YUW0_CUSEU|nr:unnamed protein product [Cuscuta europaea]